MKRLAITGMVMLVFTLSLGAQEASETADAPPVEPAVFQSAHYSVSHPGGEEAAQETAAIMEAYLQLYNSYFLLDISSLGDSPLNVMVYQDVDSFSSAVLDKTGETRRDFVYLHYNDPTESSLLMYMDAENEVSQMGFQGFIQFLWNVVPNAPAWIQEGFAYHFWDYEWKNSVLLPKGQFPFLTRTLEIFGTGESDIQTIIATPEGTGGTTYSHLAWATVYFLIQNQNPTYIRLTGTLLASLKPENDLAANQTAVLAPINGAGGIDQLAEAVEAFIAEQKSIGTLLQEGTSLLSEENYADARESFIQAQSVSPGSYLPDYYIGLAYYEEEDYANAKTYFEQLRDSQTPAGLVDYVLALTNYQLGEFETAGSLVSLAKEADPTKYGDLADKLLSMIE